MIVTVIKRPRCKSCDSDDNFRSNIEYSLHLDSTIVDNRLWFWDGNTGYYTDNILKKINNIYVSKNARYEVNSVSDSITGITSSL